MQSTTAFGCLRLWDDLAIGDSSAEAEEDNLGRILVIVSEAALRKQIVPVLSRANFAVMAVSSSRQGWNILFEKDPDLIIMGEEVSSLAPRIRQVSAVPIIVIGSNGNKMALVRTLVSGADCYMTKPLNLEELVIRTQVLLRRSGKSPAEGIPSLVPA